MRNLSWCHGVKMLHRLSWCVLSVCFASCCFFYYYHFCCCQLPVDFHYLCWVLNLGHSLPLPHIYFYDIKRQTGKKKGINGPMPDLEELTKFCNVKLKQTLLYLDKMKANKEPDPQTNWVLEPLKYNFMINSC